MKSINMELHGRKKCLRTEKVLSSGTMIEKPNPDEAPSCLAVAARYIFSERIFDALQGNQTGQRKRDPINGCDSPS